MQQQCVHSILLQCEPHQLLSTRVKIVAAAIRTVATGTVQIKAVNQVYKLTADKSTCRLLAASGVIPPLAQVLTYNSGAEMVQLQALAALCNLSNADEANGDSIVDTGGIPPVVAFLSSGSEVPQKLAATLLQSLACNNRFKPVIAAAGAIPPLVQLLRDGAVKDTDATTPAMQALTFLAFHKGNHDVLAAASAIPVLVQLLMQRDATMILGLLAYCADSRRIIASKATGAVPTIVQLFNEAVSSVLIKVVKAVAELAGDAEGRMTIAAEGAIPKLVKLLSEGDFYSSECAAGALCGLAFDRQIRHKIVAVGAIPRLVDHLRCASSSSYMKRMAARALEKLAVDVDYKKTIAAAGAIPALVQLLRVGPSDAKDWAAAALSNLALTAEKRKIIGAEGAIPLLVKLRSEGEAKVKERATRALKNLAVDPGNKQLLLASGARMPGF